MINTRAERIRTLKAEIASVNDRIRDHLTNVDVAAEAKLTEEEQKASKQKRMEDFGILRANIKVLQEDLKKLRANKHDSSFFEFTPHVGMNRRQAKQFRKQRRV